MLTSQAHRVINNHSGNKQKFGLEKKTEPFKDVPADYWAAKVIDESRDLGIFAGDPNGNFRPKDPLLRGEAAATMVKYTKLLREGEIPLTPEHVTRVEVNDIIRRVAILELKFAAFDQKLHGLKRSRIFLIPLAIFSGFIALCYTLMTLYKRYYKTLAGKSLAVYPPVTPGR